MFIVNNLNQLEKAAMKARTIKPLVRIIEFGTYSVKGANSVYTVRMERKDGEKRVICECKAANRGFVCYHGCAALELHSTLAKHRSYEVIH